MCHGGTIGLQPVECSQLNHSAVAQHHATFAAPAQHRTPSSMLSVHLVRLVAERPSVVPSSDRVPYCQHHYHSHSHQALAADNKWRPTDGQATTAWLTNHVHNAAWQPQALKAVPFKWPKDTHTAAHGQLNPQVDSHWLNEPDWISQNKQARK